MVPVPLPVKFLVLEVAVFSPVVFKLVDPLVSIAKAPVSTGSRENASLSHVTFLTTESARNFSINPDSYFSGQSKVMIEKLL